MGGDRSKQRRAMWAGIRSSVGGQGNGCEEVGSVAMHHEIREARAGGRPPPRERWMRETERRPAEEEEAAALERRGDESR